MLSDKDLLKKQQYLLRCLGTEVCVDTHCHCLPGLDDGPDDLAQSLALCQALVCEGFTHVVATPHQLGDSEDWASAIHIQRSVTDLNKTLVEHGIPLIVLSGAEIRIDERIPDLLARGELLPLGDTQEYVLVEWPFETCFHPRGLFELFRGMGYKPVIAHPERNQVIAANPSLVMDWIEYNPIFQITGASLTGQFGRTSTSAAWALLDLPVKSVVCTDAHDTTHRAPVFIEAFGAIVRQRGVACAQRICIHGPLDIVGTIQPRTYVPNYSKGKTKSA